MILMNRLVQVDGKYRKDPRYPAGFQDIITIPRTDQNFRILYDTKGRMVLVPVNNQESSYKLCKVMKANIGRGAIPYVSTHDGRTIRFPHPEIKVGDSIKFDLKEKKIVNYFKLDIGANIMVIKGRNTGRVGHLRKIEKHPGAQNIAHVEDARGHRFATRLTNIFVIGTEKVEITLPKSQGVQRTILEETKIRLDRQAKNN